MTERNQISNLPKEQKISSIESAQTVITEEPEKKESIHFDDQMEMYLNFKTKKMTFDKQEIYSKAKRIYNPN